MWKMILEKNNWQNFLNKMTALSAKGWILRLDLAHMTPPLSDSKRSLLQDLLVEAQKEKRFSILDNPNPNDVFLYFAENKQDDLQALSIKLLFHLGLSFDSSPTGQVPVFTVYHLSEDWQKLQRLFLMENVKSPAISPQIATSSFTPVLPPQTSFNVPFTPALLAQLERNLEQADLSTLMRHQSVCALVGKAQPVELFEEVYVALGDLKKAMCPTVNIYESPWLLDRLLETLDKRVLENMVHHDSGAFRKNFSLNIAVNTLLSPDFERFNESLEDSFKSSILLEVKQSDVFNNLSAFLAARSFVLSEGYRLCIDTVTADSLAFIDKEKLGASFIKLLWSPELLHENKNESFLNSIQANDPSSIILCRVDDKRAIEWGQKLGLSLFQGYYIQKLLYQMPRPRQ